MSDPKYRIVITILLLLPSDIAVFGFRIFHTIVGILNAATGDLRLAVNQ